MHELVPNPRLTAAGLWAARWYVVVDDEIGGWCVANVDLPTSAHDPNLGHRSLADFTFREHADAIVAWHNTQLEYL